MKVDKWAKMAKIIPTGWYHVTVILVSLVPRTERRLDKHLLSWIIRRNFKSTQKCIYYCMRSVFLWIHNYAVFWTKNYHVVKCIPWCIVRVLCLDLCLPEWLNFSDGLLVILSSCLSWSLGFSANRGLWFGDTFFFVETEKYREGLRKRKGLCTCKEVHFDSRCKY